MAPTYNVMVPYLGVISRGLIPGKLVRIQGMTPPTSQRFEVNLQNGPDSADIALHISVRFGDNSIVRTARINGMWGPEERFGIFPLKRGSNFEILIRCDLDFYKIAVNGQHFTEFEHRIPYHRVSHLRIGGDVMCSMLSYEEPVPGQELGEGEWGGEDVGSGPEYNPMVPYLNAIHGGLTPGRMIRIQGSTSTFADRFHINLQCGLDKADIALHLSVRFGERAIVRNSKQYGRWCSEERAGRIPIERGQNFEILLLCEDKYFKIAVNGQHFTEFMHRIPYQRVSHLQIEHDVTLSMVNQEAPSHGSKTKSWGGNYLMVPYLGTIKRGLTPGRMIRIQGETSPTAHSFNINLQSGSNISDIALHISVCFGENAVVRNSLLNGRWGSEERHGKFPLERGQNFEILILCDPDFYKIAVNGQHFTEFVHRTAYQRVNHIYVEHDVTLSMINYEEPPNGPGVDAGAGCYPFRGKYGQYY